MDDALLFACGGGASHMLDVHALRSMQVIRVNPKESANSFEGDMASPLAAGNPDDIRERLRGVRVAFVFAVLGGFSGTDMLIDIATIARQEGCKVVSIAGIPMGFEKDRRDRAMRALGRVVAVSDRLILFDMATVLKVVSEDRDPKFDALMRISAKATVFALDCLAHLVEGPFFSTFSEVSYTFSYKSDENPVDAVMGAMGSYTFPTDPELAKAVVFVSSTLLQAERDMIFDTVVSSTGILPDIVKREDTDDTKVAVFLPVDLSRPFPRVSHP